MTLDEKLSWLKDFAIRASNIDLDKKNTTEVFEVVEDLKKVVIWFDPYKAITPVQDLIFFCKSQVKFIEVASTDIHLDPIHVLSLIKKNFSEVAGRAYQALSS